MVQTIYCQLWRSLYSKIFGNPGKSCKLINELLICKDTFPKTDERYFIDIYALLIGSKSHCFCTHTTGEFKSATRATNTATKYCFVSKILSIDFLKKKVVYAFVK